MQGKVNNKMYELSPLRAKHIKRIPVLIAEKEQKGGGVITDFDIWFPFIADSIKVLTPGFNVEELDEMTLQEFNDIWEAVTKLSGISFQPKTGEQTPAGQTGTSSSPASVAPSA